ncbi:hypothetical protein ACKKBF_B31820 [Auxenochlorella protothecoides x Auxenochlorella symbiontica]
MASGGPDRESGDDARVWREARRSLLAGVALLAVLLLSLVPLTWCLPALSAEDLAILKSFPPRTLGTLLEQREVILRYAATSPNIVAVCFCMAYVVMQSLAIPGTLVLSVLAGAIYGHWRGWALVSGISTLGALSCYTLSLLIGRPIVRALWPLRTERFAAEVAARRGQLLPFVIFLRVTPLLPNTFINVASPLAGVPVWPFSLGTLLGCMPNNFVAVGAGTRLSSMNSLADLYDARAILLGLGFGALALMSAWLQRRHAGASAHIAVKEE